MAPLGHADLDDGQRLAKLEERVFSLEQSIGLQVRLAVSELREDMAKKHGRTEIANVLVFGVAGLILVAFFGVVTAYFIGRPPGAPVSIRASEGIR